MANDISLTASLRSNLLSLQRTQRLMDMTQFRLATGKKVNSALENANSFFASQTLTNRATDLSFLLDSMGQGIQVLKATDQGITAITNLVNQANSIAQSARDTTSNSAAFRSGDLTAALATNVGAIGSTLDLTSGSGATATITVTGRSLAAIAADINATSGFSAVIIDGTPNATTGATNKRLEIRAVGGNTLTIANNAAGTFFNANNGGVGGSAGSRLDTGAAYVLAAAIASSQNTPDAVALEKQFNAIRTQIDQMAQDAGYRGTNLLNGDSLTVRFNEDNSSNMTVAGVTFNASGLGIVAADFRTGTLIDSALSGVSLALSNLRIQAKTFGVNLNIIQSREDFTKDIVNTLKEGSDKLVLADTNEEGANLLSLQTSQQLGVTSLSLASQSAQSVLRLFQ